MAAPLFTAFEELRDCCKALARSSYQTVGDALARVVACLDEEPIRSHLASILPIVDFDAWYKEVHGADGKGVGRGEIDWPVRAPERVALQAELLRRMASGQINILAYTLEFHYVGSSYNSNIGEFMEQTLQPFHTDLIRLSKPALEAEDSPQSTFGPSPWIAEHFISPTRLVALKKLSAQAFDFAKLVRLCEELESSAQNGNLLAIAALTRALLDHVPPLFGASSFAQVANNYPGSRSFRDSMLHLENSARRIGDAHLHVQIRQRESLPSPTQVNFANDIDVLLAEIIRIAPYCAI
jgi:hypothetical protein